MELRRLVAHGGFLLRRRALGYDLGSPTDHVRVAVGLEYQLPF